MYSDKVVSSFLLNSLLCLCAIPFFVLFIFSFIEFIDGQQIITLQAFRQLFSNIRLTELSKITFRAVIVSSIATIFSFLISYALFRIISKRVRLLFLLIITIPFLINESVRVFSWQLVLSENGLFNSWISYITGREMLFFNGSNDYNVVFIMMISIIPFGIFINTASLIITPSIYWKAAEDIGINSLNTFIKIVLPISRISLLITFIISFFLAFSLSSEVNYLGGASKISVRNLVLSFMSSSSFSSIFLLGSILTLIIIILNFIIKAFINNRSE